MKYESQVVKLRFKFSKFKTCKCWTLIKIKISMTCVYKEYEVKIMVQVQWLELKWSFYWVIAWTLLFSGGNKLLVEGGINIWWGECTGGIFPGGEEDEQIFSKWKGLPFHPPYH